NTLLAYKYHRKFYAEDGKPGSNARKRGLSGDDIYLHLPLGTEIYQITETGERIKIADITTHNEEIILAHGGRGGKGNSNFATATNQAPRHATLGKKTQEQELELVLKLMADVGLVGFPNAGKSTLLSVLSSARPKIADYEFTTLEPMLGVVKGSDYRSFVMADIPGIIEGAHEGKGLGHQFLQHIQRTAILLFLIDINTPDPIAAYQTLRSELYLYDKYLDTRPFIVVISKMDTVADPDEAFAPIGKAFKEQFNVDALPISSVTHLNLDKLTHRIFELLDEQ
ncbi:MAG TPA: GTPase ObgE, partial [Candidatus Cloacimonas sp.]|nr:GTPase ObgE [Candidatus Cloacimonas sp.]